MIDKLTIVKPKTGAQRVKECEDRHRSLGQLGRKVWATAEEHEEIKSLLKTLRIKLC